MIDVLAGDIFGARAEAYVNPVNCVGVMGKGLALHFKREFPRNFLAYEDSSTAPSLTAASRRFGVKS